MESTSDIKRIMTMLSKAIQSNFILLAVMLLLNLGLIQSAHALVTGPGSAWPYCRQITLSPVTPVANLQVKITFAAGQYGNMKSDGSDLLFYDINNNICNYWIETWNNAGTSVIWVKVPVSGTTYLYMYYGNASASATSSGASTFDFFDGFDGASLGANWAKNTSNGTITVSGGTVTISCTSSGGANTTPMISSAFTPSSTSFWMETKHTETAYNRVRFYAATSSLGSSPLSYDYGYFYNGSGAQNSAVIFWNGYQSQSVTRNTDYLTAWQITDGSTYNWYTNIYSTGASVDSRTTTYGSNIRYITIGSTEVSGTATSVDWVRVRKYNATIPASTIGSQLNLSASITGQTNVTCYGLSNGNATVTASGGLTPYSYLWSNAQITQTATGLSATTYTVTVTDNIGLTATASATITQPTVVSTSINNKTNISCFAGSDGTITVQASGGSGTGYEFSKDNGDHWTSGASNPFIFTGLSANTPYKIKAKDNNACESIQIP